VCTQTIVKQFEGEAWSIFSCSNLIGGVKHSVNYLLHISWNTLLLAGYWSEKCVVIVKSILCSERDQMKCLPLPENWHWNSRNYYGDKDLCVLNYFSLVLLSLIFVVFAFQWATGTVAVQVGDNISCIYIQRDSGCVTVWTALPSQPLPEQLVRSFHSDMKPAHSNKLSYLIFTFIKLSTSFVFVKVWGVGVG